MAVSALSSSSWLREFGSRAEAFVQEERPASLIEFEVAAEERERLYLGTWETASMVGV